MLHPVGGERASVIIEDLDCARASAVAGQLRLMLVDTALNDFRDSQGVVQPAGLAYRIA